MIAFQSESSALDCYDRPGSSAVARLRGETSASLNAIDQPADLLAEALSSQLAAYSGPMPQSRDELRTFVVRQFRGVASVTAVSAMIQEFIENDEQSHLAKAIRRMLVVIRMQARPALTCDALAVAMGIHLGEGRTLEEIARAHGVTKQALSKRAVKICEDLGLRPSVLMRTENSRESYRLKQRQRHAAARAAGAGGEPIDALKRKLAAARQHVSGRELRSA